MKARLAGRAAAMALLIPLTAPNAPAAPRAASADARLTGTITVSIRSSRVKHWGLPGAEAAFVPDADHSAYAARIRGASNAGVLCAALEAAAADPRIATEVIDGDGSMEHRLGDEESMSFILVVAHPLPATRGRLFVCSAPTFAMMSRGAYPRERFYQVSAVHRLEWRSGPLTLDPGASVPLHFKWKIDASSW